MSVTEQGAPDDLDGRIERSGDSSGTTSPRSSGPAAGGSGLGGWLRWAWRVLTSMRTALVLLLVLVLAAVPGSVFPQRVSDELAVAEFLANNPTLGPLLDRLGMFDVFGSTWFAAIYLLLFISLLGCVVPRAAQLLRQWRYGPPEPPRRFGDRAAKAVVDVADGSAALSRAEQDLRTRGWRTNHGPGWVAAEKGFLREVGNLAFHLSMLALLVAVALGSLLGWSGNVVVREGQGFANTLTQYDQWSGGRAVDAGVLPPFAFTLESFTVAFERGEAQRGAPRDFDALVTLQREPTAPQESVRLRVNEPLRIDGADVYLIGHGYAPRVTVASADGRTLFDDSVVFLPRDGNFTSTGVIKLPDARPQLAFTGIFAPTATIDEAGPRSVFPAPDAPGLFLSAFVGDLGLDSGVPQNVYELDTTDLEQVGLEGLAPGQSWTLEDGTTLTFEGVERFVALKISHDPGRLWALLAVGLVLGGLMVSLFVPRRRIWLRHDDDRVTIAGLARTENGAPAADVQALAEAMGRAEGTVGDNGPSVREGAAG